MHRVPRITVVIGLAAVAAATASAAAPPKALFRDGYNLCRAASLKEVRAAGKQPYKRGLFVDKSCLWERADLKAGITLATHPRAAGSTLMRQLLARNGQDGFVAKRVAVPGATGAIVVTPPHSMSTGLAKDLFASYRSGVVQVNMSEPKTLPNARLIAVLEVVTS